MVRRSIMPGLRPLESSLPWIVLFGAIAYTYGMLTQIPYAGFDFRGGGRGTVVQIHVEPAAGAGLLHLDDRLVQIGPVLWSDFMDEPWLTLFDGVKAGQVVPITVERDGELVDVQWTFPGRTTQELTYRLAGEWFLAFVFWGLGTLALLRVRPRDSRWYLLVAFNYLTAAWLSGGGWPSRWHLWGGAYLVRGAAWASVPVLLQFHWVFPQPLGRAPAAVKRLGYAAAGLLIAADWLHQLPTIAYQYGYLLAALLSLGYMCFRFAFRPDQRRDVVLLATGAVCAVFPLLAGPIVHSFTGFTQTSLALVAFPVLPGAYLLAVYRRQVGGLEWRANRLLTAYMFTILVGTVVGVLVAAADARLDATGSTTPIALAAALLAALAAIYGFPWFERLIDRFLLGAYLPRRALGRQLRQTILSRLDFDSLRDAIRRDLLPSLFIRQAALVRYDDAGRTVPLLEVGLQPGEFPSSAEIEALKAEAGRNRPPPSGLGAAPAPWVRLALPLTFDQTAVGMWLLGRHDPDNFYSESQIDELNWLAQYIAIALMHLRQSERLRAFYQFDVHRHEADRAALARELHDNVLNGLAALNIAGDDVPLRFQQAIQDFVRRLRQTIGELRLPVLEHGLPTALEALADDAAERAGDSAVVLLEVAADGASYPAQAELQVYRIVQQLSENALRHAQAQTIRISGRLESDLIDLTVEDDGVGFETGEPLSLSRLVAGGQFGLTGILERAELIGGEIRIDSAPGRGTRIRLLWRPPPAES